MDYNFLNILDEIKDEIKNVSDYIYDNPELAFTEFKSSKILIDTLVKYGFKVSRNLANIETAFSGEFGEGKPVIGFLGEFDALSNGHACGHNLLGTASLAAAIATKEYLIKNNKKGTVIYFGCPGEEGGSGKAFMARDGVFDKLDIAISWHPKDCTYVRTESSLANYQVLYKFDGKASHASNNPEEGRSALDAVELMNVGVQFLREHIPTSCRIHYSITDVGGLSPNVVQPHAEVLYLIRAVDNVKLKEIYDRVNDIAKGAALMTGTKENHEFIKACSNLIMNDTLQKLMQEQCENIKIPDSRGVLPYSSRPTGSGSTDVGDVSWICPTVQMYSGTWSTGVTMHSDEACSQNKESRSFEMAIYSAKVMAATAALCYDDSDIVKKAKEEHRKIVGKDGYIAPIPKGIVPKSIMSFKK